ncbi:MAG: outer membrane lipoprotein carrier protein LolA [Tannerella sp.]|nr:outer membrane lipoprotein carrier protein LolA [Tannerella sp.]
MKKALCILFSICLLGLRANAQTTPATAEQQRLMLEQITAVSDKMNSLVCDFEQTKELSILNEKIVSKGKMYYLKDNKLRWEYQSPYKYTFLLNGDKIVLETEAGRNVIDVNSNRMFGEIANIMMSGVNGSGLKDDKTFKKSFFWDSKLPSILLEPVKKDMKQMFSSVRLTFNASDWSVETVEMKETNGDTTIIRLTGKKVNEKLDNKLFAVD